MKNNWVSKTPSIIFHIDSGGCLLLQVAHSTDGEHSHYPGFFLPNPTTPATNTEKLMINATATVVFCLRESAKTPASLGTDSGVGVKLSELVTCAYRVGAE